MKTLGRVPAMVWLPVWGVAIYQTISHYRRAFKAKDDDGNGDDGRPFLPAMVAFWLPLLVVLYHKLAWSYNERANACGSVTVYPHGDPLGIGYLRRISRAIRSHTVLQMWDFLFENMAPTYWVHGAGTWLLMTNEPENIKAILAGQFSNWVIEGPRKQATENVIGKGGIFSVNGAEWHDARALIRPSFVRDQLKDLECTDRHVEAFLQCVREKSGDGAGEAVDLQDLIFKFTMDSSTDFMFGYSTDTLRNPTPEALEFISAFEYGLVESSSRARLGWTSFFYPNNKVPKAMATCHRFIDYHVNEALSGKQKQERPYVFMNEMLASGASPETIRGQLLSMILGGRDTSASTMSSLFYVTSRRPDVMAKMRREIREELQGRKPTWEELKGLKYVNMVLKETLRLYAPVPTNMRLANEDTILPRGGGLDGQSPMFMPKGTGVRWSLWSLHRRKDVFGEDADEFRPERWESLRTTWEYIPFSGGPRICIGQQFALTMMLYLITRLLQTFESIEAADNSPMKYEVGTTMKLLHGCWVKVKPVESEKA